MLFGPAGSFAGMIVLIAGIIMTFSSVAGLILVGIGAFTGLSFSGTIIDVGRRRINHSNYFLGFIRTGSWIPLESGMSLGILAKNTTWRTFSQSNRATDTTRNDFRIMLYGPGKNPLLPVRKFKTLEQAETELSLLCNQLNLQHI